MIRITRVVRKVTFTRECWLNAKRYYIYRFMLDDAVCFVQVK